MPEIWDPQIPTGTVQNGTDYTLVGNSVDGARKVLAGAANGIATLDSAGKLVQPRRVLNVVRASGVTSSPSTTAAPGAYVLPDPRVTITPKSNGIVLVWAVVRASCNAARDSGIAASIAYSTDNFATWTESIRMGSHTTVNGHVTIPLLGAYEYITPGVPLYLGITLGGSYGDTITAVANQRNIMVMEVDY